MKQEETTSVGGGSETNITRAEIPEHLRPREYGKKELVKIPLSQLVMVSQQRGAHNPAFASIKESIDKGELINPPDIAVLSYDSLNSYLDFINKIWGSNHSISEYVPDEAGCYHLVIAGHTRVEAMIQIEDARTYKLIEAGFDITDLEGAEPTVWSKVYPDLEPEDILALQMAENLHEKPSQERTAIAMVETFLYGLEIGKWRTKREFIEQNEGKFSQDSLNKALVFCELDQATRDFVFAGAVSYGPAVELAKTVSTHRQYILAKYFNGRSLEELTEDERLSVEEEITQWNASEIAFLQGLGAGKKKINITAARRHFESYLSNWKDYLYGDEDPQGSFFSDPTREWRDQRRHTRDKLRERVKEISTLPLSGAFHALQLHVQIIGPDTQEGEEMLALLDSGVRKFEGKLREVVAGAGSLALSAS